MVSESLKVDLIKKVYGVVEMTLEIPLQMFAFVTVLSLAVVMLLLAVFRQSKFSAVWSTISFIFWFALGGLNFIVFETTPALLPLSWLWYVIGIVAELIGFYITFSLWKADQAKKEFEV